MSSTKQTVPYECDLCASNSFHPIFTFENKHIVECTQCRLRSYHPLPDEADLTAIYTSEEYFTSQYFNIDETLAKTAHWQHFIKTADLAKEQCGKEGKVLEVGPGTGAFIRLCQDREINIEGIEYSPGAAKKLSERLSCTVSAGTLEQSDFAPGIFDMIVAFDLLEHVKSPALWLSKVHQLLKPAGVLAFSTVSVKNLLDVIGRMFYITGMKSPARKLHPQYHLYYFTHDTVLAYLKKTGFEVEEITQENYDPQKATSSYLQRAFLKFIYLFHDLTGKKTNLYMTARKR